MTGKKTFVCGPEQQRTVETLREVFMSPPILALTTPEWVVVLDTDASKEVIRANMSQVDTAWRSPSPTGVSI